jgi:hypothetical protein
LINVANPVRVEQPSNRLDANCPDLDPIPQEAVELTELDALFAAQLAASSALAMLMLDALPVGAIIVIVIHVSVLRWILGRIGVVRCYLSHGTSPFRCDYLPACCFSLNCRNHFSFLHDAQSGQTVQ